MKIFAGKRGRGKEVKGRTHNRRSLFPFYPLPLLPVLLFASLALASCALRASREGIPPQAQAAIDSITEDMAAGRYQKIYEESAEEWRRTTSEQKSDEFFKTLKAKLGNVKNRSYHSATESQAGGNLPGHSFVITYNTTFERGEGMETFTLLERDGRWLLAGYLVNSDALR